MIGTSDQMAAALLAGGFIGEYVADVIVDGDRVLEDAPLSNVDLTWSRDQKVRATGRCVFVYSDEIGESIVPTDLTSALTPYATILNVSYRVTAGGFQEKLLLGPLKIIRITDPVDSRLPFQGSYISIGSSVGIQLADKFRVTDKEKFPAPFGPSDLSSVWAEIGRLTGLPLNRNVADLEIPSTVTYKENRLDAVFDLGIILGGKPYVDELGRVAIDSDTWPDPTEELPSGEESTIISRVPADLTDEGIYNQVVVRAYQNSDGLVLGHKEKEDGPLRYGGVFGRVPYFASSQYVTTEAEADQYAADELELRSALPAVQFNITIVPDPRRQVGDVIPFEWEGNSYLGRVQEVGLASDAPMRLRVISRLLGPVGSGSGELFDGFGEGGFGEGGFGA